MTMRYADQLRVLVVGGGIAGLTLALALEQRGMRAEIVERAQGYGGVGYVLGLWPAGLDVLYSLGLREAIGSVGLRGGPYTAHDRSGRPMLRADLNMFAHQYGDALYLARADLIRVLHEALSVPVRFGMTVEWIEQRSDAVDVTFSDGSQALFDVVIGADGLRSRMRDLCFGSMRLESHGITGWAFWTHVDIGNETMEYYTRGRFMGLYPSKERACCFAATVAPVGVADDAATRRAHLEKTFSDFPEFARSALASSTDPTIWHDDFLDVRMKRWVSGNVALLGDAAAAILPTAGVGASIAIESALVLADELSRATSATVADALHRYERRRRKRVDAVQAQSRQLAWMIRVNTPLSAFLRDAFMRNIPPALFAGMFKPLLQSAI